MDRFVADEYLEILNNAKYLNNKNVLAFCKKFIYPFYKQAKKEASQNISKHIILFWENIDEKNYC